MGWKAGSSTVNITPEGPMWMAGYAARNKPSESVLQELFAKVLVIEDAGGTSVAIVTCDLIGIPRTLRESLEAKVLSEFGLPRDALLLNASHTHCGPELRVSKVSAYELGEDRVRQAEEYTRGLEDKLTGAIGEAIERLEPATLEYCYARCGFAMNRRLPVDGSYRNSPDPDAGCRWTVRIGTVRIRTGRSTIPSRCWWCGTGTTTLRRCCSVTPATTRRWAFISSTATTPVSRRSTWRRRCPACGRCF
ncbi:MAG: hypothetical protein DWQ29_05750 [Planctomycetota bacterium]|nr:MAG: hypothetical protein DWQ29_05750 [Planctomycetota bacterium]